MGQFSQSVAHTSTVVIQARRPRQIVFDDLDDWEIGKRFFSFVAVPDGASEADARRVLRHLHREPGLTHAGSVPEHDNRAAAGSRTLDDRANRATFRFPPHKRGSFRERERRNLQDHWRGRRRRDLKIGARRSGIGTRGWWRGRLGNRRGEFPRDREVGVGLVGTEGAGLDASRQDIAQRCIALRDSFQYRLDRLADTLPGSLGS